VNQSGFSFFSLFFQRAVDRRHLPAAVHRTAATALGDLATDSVRKRDGEAPM
jgi:hypothetical protein